LTVGGLYRSSDPSTTHPRWIEHRHLAPGDELVIRIGEADRCDPPASLHVTSAADVERQQRAYYEQMKARFEPSGEPPQD
jgi:hypothetical protein